MQGRKRVGIGTPSRCHVWLHRKRWHQTANIFTSLEKFLADTYVFLGNVTKLCTKHQLWLNIFPPGVGDKLSKTDNFSAYMNPYQMHMILLIHRQILYICWLGYWHDLYWIQGQRSRSEEPFLKFSRSERCPRSEGMLCSVISLLWYCKWKHFWSLQCMYRFCINLPLLGKPCHLVSIVC